MGRSGCNRRPRWARARQVPVERHGRLSSKQCVKTGDQRRTAFFPPSPAYPNPMGPPISFFAPRTMWPTCWISVKVSGCRQGIFPDRNPRDHHDRPARSIVIASCGSLLSWSMVNTGPKSRWRQAPRQPSGYTARRTAGRRGTRVRPRTRQDDRFPVFISLNSHGRSGQGVFLPTSVSRA